MSKSRNAGSVGLIFVFKAVSKFLQHFITTIFHTFWWLDSYLNKLFFGIHIFLTCKLTGLGGNLEDRVLFRVFALFYPLTPSQYPKLHVLTLAFYILTPYLYIWDFWLELQNRVKMQLNCWYFCCLHNSITNISRNSISQTDAEVDQNKSSSVHKWPCMTNLKDLFCLDCSSITAAAAVHCGELSKGKVRSALM